MCPVILRQEYRFWLFKNKALKRMYKGMKKYIMRSIIICNIIRMIKLRWMKGARDAACIGR
jgi:hypothetical protein